MKKKLSAFLCAAAVLFACVHSGAVIAEETASKIFELDLSEYTGTAYETTTSKAEALLQFK